jgi:hypothetical protein
VSQVSVSTIVNVLPAGATNITGNLHLVVQTLRGPDRTPLLWLEVVRIEQANIERGQLYGVSYGVSRKVVRAPQSCAERRERSEHHIRSNPHQLSFMGASPKTPGLAALEK